MLPLSLLFASAILLGCFHSIFEADVTATGNKTKSWTGNEIRETFLKFFESKGHRRVRSSSLVPHGDPTLLFTNAGMNQFKDVFLGLEKRDYTRATTAQKCVRAGGKHNDLENVGFTKRHHTFFEMLGNFSFGDYFKKDAIACAWELLTSTDWFAIPKDKLYITVFGGAEVAPGNTLGVDEEAKKFWLEQNVPADRIVPIPGLKDNFWAMGDNGPCGPCSEIFYDMGPAASEEGHADCKFPCDCGRYVEIWNLVFMQFNREEQLEEGKGGAASLRVIADHARATTFLITDGVLPSNEGRGYVLRKIIRRAIRHGRLLGQEKSFLSDMVLAVTDLMGRAYPELLESRERVRKMVESEETRFARTLSVALTKLDDLIERAIEGLEGAPNEAISIALGGAADSQVEGQRERARKLDGQEAFRLYDTFGLPIDFIQDAARDAGVEIDQAAFDDAMLEQRTKARASWKGGSKDSANPGYAKIAETFKTEKDFYHSTKTKDARIEAIISKNGPVHELKPGESGEVVLDRTVIYAESGGQISDTGAFYDNSESQLLAEVTGAYYPVAGLVAHKVIAKETLRVGDRVSVVADAERRNRVMRNHTGTHLVHAALRNILGTHVKQAGSLNAPDRLRFDFSHFAHVDAEELRDIEQQVNDEIRHNTQITTDITSLDNALASGALAFFGDKYPDANVRVVTIPDERAPRGFYSKELCGGTHVHKAGDIGVLKIVGEESVAAGVRRIEAVTGIGALEHFQKQAEILTKLQQQLNVGEDAVLAHVEKLSQTVKQLEKELAGQKRKGALSQLDDLASSAQTIKGTKAVIGQVANIDREAFRQLVDSLRQKLGSGVVVLGMPDGEKAALIAGVTKDLTAKVNAGKLLQAIVKPVGGKGGGRPDLAEGGVEGTAALEMALRSVPSLLEPLL